MKRALSSSVVAVFVTLMAPGCSSSVGGLPPPATGDTGNDVPRTGTTWPTGSNQPAPQRRPYPLVLAHGFFGFRNIGPLTYFYGVQDALSKDGREVYVTQVDPFNSSEVRGAQLKTQVEGILASSGAPKVNLICHSQGALDCRYVANQLGKRIGAVVLVGGTNRGDYVADAALGLTQSSVGDALGALIALFGSVVLDPAGNPDSDFKAAIAQMSTAGATAFNAKYPDDPDVAYFSIAGRSNFAGDYDCGSQTEAPFIEKWDPVRAPIDPLLAATEGIINGAGSPPPTNDGLVTVASAKWGTFLGCVPASHLGEVCQIGGQSSGSSYDCVTMYRDIAAWLVAQGF